MAMDPGRKAQIEAQIEAQSGAPSGAQCRAQTQSGAQVGALLFDKAATKVPAEYSNYSDVFLAKNAAELLENTGINEHVIKLKEGK